MRAITRRDLTLWTGRSPETEKCATCGRPTRSVWEDETGLIQIRACCFECTEAEYRHRLSLDHEAGHHTDISLGCCPLCDEATVKTAANGENGRLRFLCQTGTQWGAKTPTEPQ